MDNRADFTYGHLEATAALMMSVAQHEDYAGYYRSVSDQVGGFPGIWNVVMDYAVALEDTVKKQKIGDLIWECRDFITCIDTLANDIVTNRAAYVEKSLIRKALHASIIRD